jgi:hypothetical protein
MVNLHREISVECVIKAVRLAVTAGARHRFTKHDEFLQEGRQRIEARSAVSDAVDRKFREWTKLAPQTNL